MPRKHSLPVVVLLLALGALTACGNKASWYRTRYYATTPDRVGQSVERALTTLGYPFARTPGDGPPDYHVGPLWFDADHQRLDEAPAGAVPDGTERIELWVGVGGNVRLGHPVHIRGAVWRYRQGNAVLRKPSTPPSLSRSHDALAFDSELAAVADPVFVKVYQQLEDVAGGPP